MDITVIIPFNKDRGYLKQAIKSAEDQTFSGDVQVLAWRGDNPVSVNINKALECSDGKYIKICAEDDILYPNCLEDLHRAIEDKDFVCANAHDWVESQDKTTEFHSTIPFDVRALAILNTIHGLTVMYRKESLDLIKEIYGFVFDESLTCAEEYDLHLRMLEQGMKLAKCDKFVAKYRIHDDQKSLGKNVHKGQRIKDRFDEKMRIKNKYL